MKLAFCLFAGLVLSLSVLATGGSSTRHEEQKKMMNSQQRMEERQNNSSILKGSGSGANTESDGYGTTEKDIRPQGKKHNTDYSDQNLNTNDE